jgi:Protein of unknown function (DUF1353)
MPFITLTHEIEDDWERRKGKSWWKPKDRPNEPEILLRQVNPNRFHLMEGFRYELPERDRRKGEPYRWDVPAHELDLAPDALGKDNSTDLASVPPWLWWFISSHGRQTKPALLHDHLIDREDVTDEQADRAFRIALIESDMSILRAWIIWTTVSLASTKRKKPWGLLAVIAYGVHLLAFFGSGLYWWLGGSWLVPLALGLAGLLIWRWRWVFGVLGAALIALPTLVVWMTYLVAWLLDWGVTIAYRLWAALRRIDVHIPSPDIAKPYRRQPGRF